MYFASETSTCPTHNGILEVPKIKEIIHAVPRSMKQVFLNWVAEMRFINKINPGLISVLVEIEIVMRLILFYLFVIILIKS